MWTPGVILARDGKVVIRPDSGDPEKIICGDPNAPVGTAAHSGTVGTLWNIFGGTTNIKGFRQLDPHIGVIYGDSITLDRCEAICRRLKEQGFASTNMVFGIGSYTYQYVTRDTFGFAMKATFGIVKGKPMEIFKDPLTDGGVKKSAKGLLRVDQVNGTLQLTECVGQSEERPRNAADRVQRRRSKPCRRVLRRYGPGLTRSFDVHDFGSTS